MPNMFNAMKYLIFFMQMKVFLKVAISHYFKKKIFPGDNWKTNYLKWILTYLREF